MPLREIIPTKFEDDRPKGEKCPKCGGETRYGQIPCLNPPRKDYGCLVMHYGY